MLSDEGFRNIYTSLRTGGFRGQDARSVVVRSRLPSSLKNQYGRFDGRVELTNAVLISEAISIPGMRLLKILELHERHAAFFRLTDVSVAE